MSQSRVSGFKVRGISTCVPPTVIDNLALAGEGQDDVRKVVSMAGVRHRHVVADGVTSVDLCVAAAAPLLARLGWAPESITGLIFVTQSPDYLLPSSACIAQARLGLGDHCAAFDIGLGCSGYPYGLYIAATMLRGGGHQRILLLHGETPSRFAHPDDRSTALLFGDAGSATALEYTGDDGDVASFVLGSDGAGAGSLIIRGGGFRDRTPADPRDNFVRMDGAGIFNFTIKRVPPLIADALQLSGSTVDGIDAFVFHQSNRYIMRHLAKKCGLPEERVPLTIAETANCGGPSVAVTLAQAPLPDGAGPSRVMLLGYGVGLSWGAAVISLDRDVARLHHVATESTLHGRVAESGT